MEHILIDLASKLLGITPEEAQKYSKDIPELCAFYFWKPTRGGGAVIINTKGEKLAAGSAISFEKHVKAFRDGRRN